MALVSLEEEINEFLQACWIETTSWYRWVVENFNRLAKDSSDVPSTCIHTARSWLLFGHHHPVEASFDYFPMGQTSAKFVDLADILGRMDLDLADILRRMDLDFKYLHVFEFLGTQISGFPDSRLSSRG